MSSDLPSSRPQYSNGHNRISPNSPPAHRFLIESPLFLTPRAPESRPLRYAKVCAVAALSLHSLAHGHLRPRLLPEPPAPRRLRPFRDVVGYHLADRPQR